MKTTQVNACMATADHDRQEQSAHRRYKLRTMVEVASGKGHAWMTPVSTRGSAHDFSGCNYHMVGTFFTEFVFVVDWDSKKILPIAHQFYGYRKVLK